MAGLVSKAMQGGQTQNKQGVKDEKLRAIDQQMQSRIPADAKQMYDATVVAGMRMAFDPKMQGKLMQGLQSSPDIVKNIALVVTGIISMVYTESKQDINKFAVTMVPAGVSLMCEIMQFASDSGLIQISDEAISKCTSIMTKSLLSKFGVSEDKIKQAVSAGGNAASMGA